MKKPKNKFYCLVDPDGREHVIYGSLKFARAEALERGYNIDEIEEMKIEN